MLSFIFFNMLRVSRFRPAGARSLLRSVPSGTGVYNVVRRAFSDFESSGTRLLMKASRTGDIDFLKRFFDNGNSFLVAHEVLNGNPHALHLLIDSFWMFLFKF